MSESLDVRAKDVFDAVIDHPRAERSAQLERACLGDGELRARAEALLNASEKQDGFLADPTLRIAPQPFSSAMNGWSGAAIGPYALVELIGEGGFGTVFLAEQHAPVRRHVALKIIKSGMDTKQVIARFEAERQALALMDHPNIARSRCGRNGVRAALLCDGARTRRPNYGILRW